MLLCIQASPNRPKCYFLIIWESNKCKEGRTATLPLAFGSTDDKYLGKKKIMPATKESSEEPYNTVEITH